MTTTRKPIYCVTAPVVTAETEQLELAAMSQAERVELENDLAGRVVRLDPSATEVERGVQSMRQTLAELSDNEKLEYMEAVEKVPELVASETPMEYFLRTERLDARLACQRLVSYWKTRKQFFCARTFLPMKQRDGALEKDDLVTLREQFIVLIPADRHGRPTLWLDRARIKPGNSSLAKSFLRCLFYSCHTMAIAADAYQQVAGCVAIVNLRGYEVHQHYDRILMKRIMATYNAMLLKIRVIHWCTGSPTSALFVVLPELKFLLGRYLRHRLLLHPLAPGDLTREFQRYGIHGSVDVLVRGNYEREESLQRLWDDIGANEDKCAHNAQEGEH